MDRRLLWPVAVAFFAMLPSAPLSAADRVPPVEEWQIRGILAALKDGHPEVGRRAASKLAALLDPAGIGLRPGRLHKVSDEEVNPEWMGNSLQLAKEATADLLKLLRDDNKDARDNATRALGRLKAKDALPELLELLKQGRIDRSRAFQALGRLEATKYVSEIRKLLQDQDSGVRADAADALGRLGVRGAVPELVKLLGDQDSFVRMEVANALGRLFAKEDVPQLLQLLVDQRISIIDAAYPLGQLRVKGAVPELRKLLGDQDSFVRMEAANALGRLGATEVVPELRELLNDKNSSLRSGAVMALGRLEDRQSVPELLTMLKEDGPVRADAADALGRMGAKEAVPELRKLLWGGGKPFARPGVADRFVELLREMKITAVLNYLEGEEKGRFAAAKALGQLQAKEAVPDLVLLLKDSPDVEVISQTLEVLGPSSPVAFLELIYENSQVLVSARWLAHYCGGSTDDTKILCEYLGRPAINPVPPTKAEDARQVLAVLGKAWDETNLRPLKEDVAGWISVIIVLQVKDWGHGDVPVLREHLERLRKDQGNSKAKAYSAAIESIVVPFEIWPQPWIRTVLAVVAIDTFAVFLFVLLRGRSSLESWLPFLGYTTAGTASWVVGVIAQLHLLTWLLGALLVFELMALIVVGVVSPAALRQIAKIEPLNRLAIPLALRLPWSRRRFFCEYVATVRAKLDRNRRQAIFEDYIALPANVSSVDDPKGIRDADPAKAILKHLTGPQAERGHALIEGTGGRGKSALLREVVRLALEEYDRHPASTPLPVLLIATSDSIREMAKDALQSVLLSPEFLAVHLEAGDFFLVLDGASESGLSEKALDGYVGGPYGSSTPLLLSSRPTGAYRSAIEGTARWILAEPCRLDDTTLGKFVEHYGGKAMPDQLKAKCQGRDGTYLPLLVRMAMITPGGGEVGGVADILHNYITRLFAAMPSPAQEHNELELAARWCLETYWKNYQRKQRYEYRLKPLLDAGVLVAADSHLDPPREVQFVHDLIQSYLTARGLAEDDARTNGQNRSRVLFWTAANPKFTAARSDILPTGGSELYQMCLGTFATRAILREWLHEELLRWAQDYKGNLMLIDVEAAIPPQVPRSFGNVSDGAELLKMAAQASFEDDKRRDTLEALGWQYARMAAPIFEVLSKKRLMAIAQGRLPANYRDGSDEGGFP